MKLALAFASLAGLVIAEEAKPFKYHPTAWDRRTACEDDSNSEVCLGTNMWCRQPGSQNFDSYDACVESREKPPCVRVTDPKLLPFWEMALIDGKEKQFCPENSTSDEAPEECAGTYNWCYQQSHYQRDSKYDECIAKRQPRNACKN